MSSLSEAFKPALLDAARQLAVDLSDDQAERLLAYLSQLKRWNRVYNLTAIKDEESMLIQHVFDSLAIVAPIKHYYEARCMPVAKRLLDVGSGAGLPGIILALCFPDSQVFCVDAVEKKVAFIRQMGASLQLSNLTAIHDRIEQHKPLAAQLIVSRAFASLADFVTLSQSHATPNTVFLAMKGHKPSDEIQELEQKTAWQAAKVQPLTVPKLKAHRCLVWINRKENHEC